MRSTCNPCGQREEKVEDCKRQNILYESLCKECNPGKQEPGTPLEDKREAPSIYLGESARSLFEKSSDHLRDYKNNAEESHMAKHWTNSHQGGAKPQFTQRVIKSYKSALERQVGEAVWIQLRHNVLNSFGTFNRCKLSRLVVDSERKAKVWKENWPRKRQEEMEEEEEFPTTEEEQTSKKRIQDPSEGLPARKKKKEVNFRDIAWGEEIRPVSEERMELLRSGPDPSTPRPVRQTTIVTLQGRDLAVAELINSMLRGVVEVGELNAIDRLVELEVQEWPNNKGSKEGRKEGGAGALAGP